MGYFLVFLSLLISVTAFGQYGYDLAPSIGKYQLRIDPVSKKVNLGHLGKVPNLSYELIKSKQPQNLEEFLKIIQNSSPQLFDQAVFIHTSASLQPSNINKKPRVLLFGENLTLSYSTLQKKDKSIEFLQFNNQDMTYSMHEIVFQENGKVQYNDAPTACASCHGDKPRPVWEAYDFWPSALGSQSGRTHSEQEKKLLEWVKNTDHKDPVLKKINYETLKESIDTFTAFLAQQNFLRASEKIKVDLKPDGRLYPFRYAMLGLLSCTDKGFSATVDENIIFKEFIPDAVRDSWRISFDKVYYDVLASNVRVKETLWEYYLRRFPGNTFPSDPIGGLTRLRTHEIVTGSQLGYIFANLGLNLRDFTLSYREDSYIMSTPNVADFDLQKTFLYYMPELLDELEFKVKTVVGGDFEFYELNCDQLKKKSMEALKMGVEKQPAKFLTASRPQKNLPPIGSCVSCHSKKQDMTSDAPPYIPFDDSFALGEQLRKTDLYSKIQDRISRGGPKKMPKDLPRLTETQQKSLLEVLRGIEKGTRTQ